MKARVLRKTFQKVFITLITAFLSFTVIHGQEYKVRMAFIGNSITQGVYGYGLVNSEVSYVTQFGNLMETLYGDTLDILNAGVSGRCMLKDGPAPIWNEAIFATAIKTVPDICFILLGTNDSKPLLWADKGDGFYEDYHSMIDTFRFRNPDTKFIICDPTPIWDGHPYSVDDPHNDTTLVNYTIPLIDSVAKETGVYLLDLHTSFVDSIQYFDDLLHPNIEGHEKMAQIIFDTVQKLDLIHSVVPGKAFVEDFYQVTNPAPAGGNVILQWETIYADSVFVDDSLVDPSGSIEVPAIAGKVYILTAKNDKNTSEFSIILETYIPEETSIRIDKSTSDEMQGVPLYLYPSFRDQHNRIMESSMEIAWTIDEGEGVFSDQTDTSVVFTPGSSGRIVVRATAGEITANKTMTVDASSVKEVNRSTSIKVFPNPVNNFIFFEVGDIKDTQAQLEIFNLLGEQIIKKTIILNAESPVQIDISSLKNGIYVYSINFGSDTLFGRFTKQSN